MNFARWSMNWRTKLSLLACGLWSLSLTAQSIQSQSTEAPTSFQSERPVQVGESDLEVLGSLPGVRHASQGGKGKVQSLFIRGQRVSDIAFSLEGIPIHSIAFGDYDISSFSLFGIEKVRVLRGGYAPTSSLPSGQIQFFLPQTESTKAEVRYGSYQESFIGVLVPGLSIAFERSENNFSYDDGERFVQREHNQSQNLSLRKWKRYENLQWWTQVLVSDQSLPGPIEFPMRAYQHSLDWTSALQGQWKNWSSDIWFQARQLESGSEFFDSHTRSFFEGFLIRHQFSPLPKLRLEQSSGFQFEHFQSDFISTKHRTNWHYSSSAFYSPTDWLLLHPQARIEWVSDLKEAFSFHGGLGAKVAAPAQVTLLSNLSFISRAPNFFDLYFVSPGVLNNPDLKRQKILQGDIGYEWKPLFADLQWKQAFFINRSRDLIRSTQLDSGEFQAQNFKSGLSWGIENELQWDLRHDTRFTAHYTYIRSRVDGNPEANQPAQLFQASSTWDFLSWLSLSPSFSYRSETRTRNEELSDKVPHQADLGMRFFGQQDSWTYSVSGSNLLSWRRVEIQGFPLPQEPHFRASLSRTF